MLAMLQAREARKSLAALNAAVKAHKANKGIQRAADRGLAVDHVAVYNRLAHLEAMAYLAGWTWADVRDAAGMNPWKERDKALEDAPVLATFAALAVIGRNGFTIMKGEQS